MASSTGLFLLLLCSHHSARLRRRTIVTKPDNRSDLSAIYGSVAFQIRQHKVESNAVWDQRDPARNNVVGIRQRAVAGPDATPSLRDHGKWIGRSWPDRPRTARISGRISQMNFGSARCGLHNLSPQRGKGSGEKARLIGSRQAPEASRADPKAVRQGRGMN